MPKISFLVPAHNEEQVIHHALDNLQRIASPDVEVLVGLDGCTDGTGDIVRRYDFPRVVELDERGGKPAVMRKLAELASGEIIVIHDADLRFISTAEGLQALVQVFLDDLQTGGVVLPPYAIPFLEFRSEIESKHLLGSSLGAHLLWRFLLDRQVEQRGNDLVVATGNLCYPFTVNVYRKGTIPDTETAADDFERFFYLRDGGYTIKVLNDQRLPYFRLSYQEIDFASHIGQRTRGHLSRRQIEEKFGFKLGLRTFSVPFLLYCLLSFRLVGWRDWGTLWLWYAAILVGWFRSRALLLSRSRTLDTRDIWRLRLRGS